MNDGIFLLLGSNQGDSLHHLAEAARRVGENTGEIVARSSVYRTAAWGVADQPDFHNQVLEIRSGYSPSRLLEKLLAIEGAMGRVRGKKWGPRIIDLDILLYGQQVVNTDTLRIPHPGIPERRFTLVPLAEIAPHLLHPLLHKTIATLLRECTDSLPVAPL